MEIQRREFIKRASTATLGLSFFPAILKASALGRGGHIPPSDRINMILIGSGDMGRRNLQDFLTHKEVQVVAVCDVDDNHSDLAKKMVDENYNNSDCRIYKDFRELLEKENADTAILALPDHWHALISIAVADKKIDIYGEKPLARYIAEGRAIVNAVNRNNIIWQMGSWQRSTVHFRKAAELVRNRRIGKVDYVEVGLSDGGHYIGNPPVLPVPKGVDWDMWLGPAPKVPFRGVLHWNWRWIMDYSGGQLTDLAGHDIDIAHWGLDLDHTGPVTIEGMGRPNNNGIYDVPVEFDFTCVYADGLKIRVANESKLKHGKGILWKGTDGWVHVNRSGLKVSDINIAKEKIGKDEISLYKVIPNPDKDFKTNNPNTFGRMLHRQNFLDCVRSREQTITPVQFGHRSISVGLLGEIAMITGQKLNWDPQKEKFSDNNRYATRLLKKPYREPWKLQE
jgi:predicted dehydrogenase